LVQIEVLGNVILYWLKTRFGTGTGLNPNWDE
jgi:hypothetical protein